jgi:hypothetical protein
MRKDTIPIVGFEKLSNSIGLNESMPPRPVLHTLI